MWVYLQVPQTLGQYNFSSIIFLSLVVIFITRDVPIPFFLPDTDSDTQTCLVANTKY